MAEAFVAPRTADKSERRRRGIGRAPLFDVMSRLHCGAIGTSSVRGAVRHPLDSIKFNRAHTKCIERCDPPCEHSHVLAIHTGDTRKPHSEIREELDGSFKNTDNRQRCDQHGRRRDPERGGVFTAHSLSVCRNPDSLPSLPRGVQALSRTAHSQVSGREFPAVCSTLLLAMARSSSVSNCRRCGPARIHGTTSSRGHKQ